MLTDDQIFETAQVLAHDASPACRNRPKAYVDKGHGAACLKLAKKIALAMREARDSAIGTIKMRGE